MVTTVLMGRGHFWTSRKFKTDKQIVIKSCTGYYVGGINLCTKRYYVGGIILCTKFGINQFAGDFSARNKLCYGHELTDELTAIEFCRPVHESIHITMLAG